MAGRGCARTDGRPSVKATFGMKARPPPPSLPAPSLPRKDNERGGREDGRTGIHCGGTVNAGTASGSQKSHVMTCTYEGLYI